jgi:hypothetical protein
VLISEALESGSDGVLWTGEDGSRVVVVTHEGWRVGVRLTARGRRAAEVSFRPPEPIAGLDQLRQLPLGELLRQARHLVAGPPQSPFRSIVSLRLSGWADARRGHSQDVSDYAWLAFEYVLWKNDGERSPARRIGERFGHGSLKVWSNRIRRARELGLWEYDHGEPRLTKRGERLLPPLD